MHTGEMDLASGQHIQDAGKTTGRAAASDALVGDGLRHPEASRTEREHRRAGMLQVQFPPIDLGDARNKRRGVLSILVDKAREFREKAVLAQTAKCVAIHHGDDANMGV